MTSPVREAERKRDKAKRKYKACRWGLLGMILLVGLGVWGWYAAVSHGLTDSNPGAGYWVVYLGLLIYSIPTVIFFGAALLDTVALYETYQDQIEDYKDALDKQAQEMLR